MRYVLDPFQEPRTIDISPPRGAVWRGIYEINQDSLRLCLNQGVSEGPRPTAFQTEPGLPTVYLYLLKRKRVGGDGR
jgi:hypothetical protein